ncbi:perlucin [Procambarus clarkii]|uniref:perlucin n=1 Tax=Procambarus clarkii TaxID=6728 RepID=UPI001E67472E|nr:perlucin-like [Procambarus clarkii]XP_045618922.1 perlucin-like [Procambarus clarkii]
MTDLFSTTTTRHHHYHYLWLLPSILLIVVVLAWVTTSVVHSSRHSASSSQGSPGPLALQHRSQGNQKDVTIQDIKHSSEMLEGDEHHNIMEHAAAFGLCECLPPYKQVLHQCYYANPNHRLDWDRAARFCKGMGGHLARPTHIPALIAFLLEHYPHVVRWYLGGSDLAEEGVWLWTDGRPVSDEDWKPSEPNGNTRENCLELCFSNCEMERDQTSSITFPSLNDESCQTTLNFVCEYNASNCVLW